MAFPYSEGRLSPTAVRVHSPPIPSRSPSPIFIHIAVHPISIPIPFPSQTNPHSQPHPISVPVPSTSQSPSRPHIIPYSVRIPLPFPSPSHPRLHPIPTPIPASISPPSPSHPHPHPHPVQFPQTRALSFQHDCTEVHRSNGDCHVIAVQHGGCGHCGHVPRDIPRNSGTRHAAHFAHAYRPSSPHGVLPQHEQEQFAAGPRSASLLLNDPGHHFGAGGPNPAGCQQRVGE